MYSSKISTGLGLRESHIIHSMKFDLLMKCHLVVDILSVSPLTVVSIAYSVYTMYLLRLPMFPTHRDISESWVALHCIQGVWNWLQMTDVSEFRVVARELANSQTRGPRPGEAQRIGEWEWVYQFGIWSVQRPRKQNSYIIQIWFNTRTKYFEVRDSWRFAAVAYQILLEW